MLEIFNDEFFMKQALIEAQKALDKNEVPVGAVVVLNNNIIARTHNLTEQLTDVTAHAEVQAITAAAQFLGAKYLKGCTMYVSLEPCSMCAGALFWSQIDKVVFAARDEKRGASRCEPQLYHPTTLVVKGPMQKESSALLKSFFNQKRKSSI
jgi:tRNA(adenine34) deaminase